MANVLNYLRAGLSVLTLNGCAFESNTKTESNNEKTANPAYVECVSPVDFHKSKFKTGDILCLEGKLGDLYGEPPFDSYIVVRGNGDQVHVRIDPNNFNQMRLNLGKAVKVNGHFFYAADSGSDMPYRNRIDT